MPTFRFTVTKAQGSQRLDALVPQLVPQLSRREVKRLVSDGAVLVHGKRVLVCSRLVPAGADVTVTTRDVPRVEVPDLEILYRDAHVVAVNKPAGMPSEPTPQGQSGTASFQLATQLDALEGPSASVFLHATHRLDADTTGVLVFGRNAPAQEALSVQWRESTVLRGYLALVAGVPSWDEQSVDVPLAKTRDARGRIQVDANGLPSLTRLRVLRRGTAAAWIACMPLTGRTHQLRVHLAHLGHPLVGDRRYGKEAARHLGLHAAALDLVHPHGEPLALRADVPQALVDEAHARGIVVEGAPWPGAFS